MHHCLHKYPAWSGVVIIDEASQIPLALWAAIQKWLFSDVTFVLLGDFRSQFGAAYNRWRQTEVDANVENSLFFRRLCGFNRVNFVKYRRGKDTSFFKLYTSLVADDVAAVKARILELFPRKGEPIWTLTVSHRERNIINVKRNEIIYKR